MAPMVMASRCRRRSSVARVRTGDWAEPSSASPRRRFRLLRWGLGGRFRDISPALPREGHNLNL